jgi:kanamycin kinase/streptomycin 3"-kinase/aminoglycoside 3'-phosphotransferase-2
MPSHLRFRAYAGAVQGWELVSSGHTDAVVRRSPDGRAYAKSGRGPVRDELAAERDRLVWLAETDLPAPLVLDWADDGEVVTLTTSAVPGVPLSDLPAASADAAAASLGSFLARLHARGSQACPFERWLAVTVPLARVHADEGEVDEDDFDTEREGRSAADLHQELLDQRPRAERLETGDLVVCHGDACLPNFLADPETLEITGMIDVGRLGVADRHLDLALATRSMADTALNPAYGQAAAEALLDAYGLPADPWRLDFYRLLDEFF